VAPTYEERKAARKARLQGIAERLRRSGDRRALKAEKMAAAIVPGTSNAGKVEKVVGTAAKASADHKKAAQFEHRAEAVGKGGVSSDDPAALETLTDQLRKAEADQEMFKAVNAAIRKTKGDDAAKVQAILRAAPGLSEEAATAFLQPDFAGRTGVPSYLISNNNANIRRLKDRIEKLGAQAQVAHQEPRVTQAEGFSVVENFAINRLQVKFPEKPSQDVRDILQGHGFRWSSEQTAWQRMLSGIHAGLVTEADGYLRRKIEVQLSNERGEGRELAREDLQNDEEIQRGGRGR
jgi:hypothetical protein